MSATISRAKEIGRSSGREFAELRLHLNEPSATAKRPLFHYPNTSILIDAIALSHGIGSANVIMTAGADAGIQLACQARSGRTVILDPDFPRYRVHSENCGNQLVIVPIGSRPFSFPKSALTHAVDSSTTLLIVSTVANPTGIELPEGLIEKLHLANPEMLIVIDEVYTPFINNDYGDFAAKTQNVISLRSFSKIGFPGLRIGYVIGHEHTLQPMRKYVSPYAIATASVESAVHIIENRAKWRSTVSRQINARRLLERQLNGREIETIAGHGNWLLANFGLATERIVGALAARKVFVQPQKHRDLEGWVRISTPGVHAVSQFVRILDDILESPFIIDNGLLSFTPTGSDPRALAKFSFVTVLFGHLVQLDHLVVTLPNQNELNRYCDGLLEIGAGLIEGPGVWPHDFCEAGDSFPVDLEIHFASALLPNGGIVVVAAPINERCQLARFLNQRGPKAIHHVAIRIDEHEPAEKVWTDRGFIPRKPVEDGNLLQQFFVNRAGQTIELIRRSSGHATFSCTNMAELRHSEVK